MLELRPTCEHCNKPLPPESMEAMICSFECTFCRDCVEDVLFNVCPNCGGGFTPRPVRPQINWNDGNCLTQHPASTKVVHKAVDPIKHRTFAKAIKKISPERR